MLAVNPPTPYRAAAVNALHTPVIQPLPNDAVVRGACPHDCPDTCAIEVTVEEGRAVAVRGGDMPFTAGTLCTKVARYLDRTYAPSRILYPMKRIGAKGERCFQHFNCIIGLRITRCDITIQLRINRLRLIRALLLNRLHGSLLYFSRHILRGNQILGFWRLNNGDQSLHTKGHLHGSTNILVFGYTGICK